MKQRTVVSIVVLAVVCMAVLIGAYHTTLGIARCGSCHDDTAFVAATQGTGHASVECVSCHTGGDGAGRVAFAIRHLPRMVLPGSTGTARDLSAVSDHRCVACHEGVFDAVTSAQGVRFDHARCVADTACTECHSSTAHGREVSWLRTYDMESCLGCHASGALEDCAVCHDGRLPGDRITTGVFAVTHGPEWESTHGMGDAATCSACHLAADCATCHGPGLPHDRDFFGQHAAFSVQDEARCESCHQTRFCDDCHGMEMPHPPRFTAEHAGAADDDRALCDRCHATSDCTRCHEMHVHPGGAIGTLEGGGQ